MDRYNSQSSLASDQPDNCPLHLGRLQDAYALPCGHAACEICLYAIATTGTEHRRPEIQCPVCQVVSPFEPERREIEEAHIRADISCGRSSRSSSVSSSVGSPVHMVHMKRFSVKTKQDIDFSASKIEVSNDAVVNKSVVIQLKLCDRNKKVIMPNKSTYVRGTIAFPDNQQSEIDLLSVQLKHPDLEEPSYSFEKVLVPEQIGKHIIEISMVGSVNERIRADILIRPSGGKVLDFRGSSKFKNPHDILVTGGQYLIVDRGNHRMVVVDREGNVQLEFGSKPPKGLKKIGPFACASDPESFYITDDKNKCVLQFLRSTGALRLWAKVGPCPTGIALDTDKVYVADAKENNIRIFNRYGDLLSTMGYAGSLDGALNFPWFLKVNSKGHILVADRNNCRIQSFDPRTQKSIMTIPLNLDGKRWHCRGLTVDRLDNIYVTARRTDSCRVCSKETVMVFSPDGDNLGNFGQFREFDYLRGIAIDDDRQMALVVDGANHIIKGYRL